MLNWISAIPAWIKFSFFVAGFLVSAFSSRLPENLQDWGLYVGVIVGTIAFLSLLLHQTKTRLQTWSAGWQMQSPIVRKTTLSRLKGERPLTAEPSPAVLLIDRQYQAPLETAENTLPKGPSRFYSRNEKECIADGLSKLSLIVSTEGLKARQYADSIGLGWEYYVEKKSRESSFSQAVTDHLTRLEGVRQLADSAYNKIYVTLLEDHAECGDELRQVIMFQAGEENHPLARLKKAVGQLSDALTTLRDLDPKMGEGERNRIKNLVRLTDPVLRNEIGNLDTWLRETKDRIDNKRKTLGQ